MTPEDIKNGFWPTPPDAIPPLLKHLEADFGFDLLNYIEPCAGAGNLINLLGNYGITCVYASDIAPKQGKYQNPNFIAEADALDLFYNEDPKSIDDWAYELDADYIITNPPFSRHHEKALREMIDRFSRVLPTWLLLPAGFAHNRRAVKHSMKHCRKIVSIGRLNWVDGTKELSRKDYAWFLFDQSDPSNSIEFFPNYGDTYV